MSTASTAPRRQSFRARGVPKHLRDYVLEEHTQIHPCSPPPELDGAAETLEGGVDMLDPEGSTGSQDMTEGQEQEKEEREEEESKDGSSDSSDSSSLDDERTVSALDRQRQRQMRRTDGHRKLKPVQLDRHGDHRVLRAPYDSNSSTSADLKRPSSISSILFTSVVPSTGLIFARVRTPPTSPRPASTAVAEYFPSTVASALPTPPVETSAYLSINHSLSLDYPDQNPVEYCNPTPHFPWTYDESLTVSGGLGHIPYRPNRQLTPDHEGASEDREGEEREESASDGRQEKPVDEAEADKVMQSWLDLNGV